MKNPHTVRRERIDHLIYQIFNNDPTGKELLNLWVDYYLKSPIWEIDCAESTAIYRAGQNKVIHDILKTIDKTNYQEDLKGEENARQSTE
ncbi:hypothetical protein LCGC14_0432860 [marine sediment metagenome]|uniref:Uncharacterized protein n=1 Tax=marine sediment metagenome TaxID=412755 RepID=A0A0F9V9N4_9ZZZZ